MHFEKWQALGNDYVIIESGPLPWELTAPRVARICDPHLGVGADGILLISQSDDPQFVATLRIFNPDGSEAELSGNGVREAILYLHRRGWTSAKTFTIGTMSGPVTPEIADERTATVAMGRASTTSKDFPSGSPDGRGTLRTNGREWDFQHVSIGNPQCSIEMTEGLEGLDLAAVGPELENHELFPNRTNVSFYEVQGDRVRARIFERGVGETMSSGTGATGAAVAAHIAHGVESPVQVILDGGVLDVEISSNLDIRLTGWAEQICTGELSGEMLSALAGL